MAQSQAMSYMYQDCIVVDHCTKYEPNWHILSEISQQTKNLWKYCHNYSNLAWSESLFHMHQQPMLPDHGTKYEENPASHQVGMKNDAQNVF